MSLCLAAAASGTVTSRQGGHGVEVEDPQRGGGRHGAERGRGGVVPRGAEPRRPGLRDVPAP